MADMECLCNCSSVSYVQCNYYFCLCRHYPTTKHTQVADTPEARRIAENTRIQSQVRGWHELLTLVLVGCSLTLSVMSAYWSIQEVCESVSSVVFFWLAVCLADQAAVCHLTVHLSVSGGSICDTDWALWIFLFPKCFHTCCAYLQLPV